MYCIVGKSNVKYVSSRKSEKEKVRFGGKIVFMAKTTRITRTWEDAIRYTNRNRQMGKECKSNIKQTYCTTLVDYGYDYVVTGN